MIVARTEMSTGLCLLDAIANFSHKIAGTCVTFFVDQDGNL